MKKPFEFEIMDNDEPFLNVRVKGHASSKNIINMYKAIHDRANQNKQNKVILDAKEMVFDYPIVEFIPLVNDIKPLLTNVKVARLCEPFEQRQELIQSYCNKLNLPLKNFSCSKEAKSWLTEIKQN